jgi:hypothetical protein
VEVTLRGVDLETRNTDVLIAKVLLLAVSTVSLIKTFRSAAQPVTPNERCS